MTLGAYPLGALDFFFFAPPTRSSSLPVVSNAPQGSARRLSTERRRATSGSYNLLLRPEPVKVERVLRGGSWADPLSKPHPQRFLSGKVPLVGTWLMKEAREGQQPGGAHRPCCFAQLTLWKVHSQGQHGCLLYHAYSIEPCATGVELVLERCRGEQSPCFSLSSP